MFEALAGIHRYLERRSIHFLVVILPSRYVYEDGPYRESSLALLGRAEARAEALGLPFLSLRGALAAAGGARLFMDFCHPTADGNRAIAKALEATLRGWSEQ